MEVEEVVEGRETLIEAVNHVSEGGHFSSELFGRRASSAAAAG